MKGIDVSGHNGAIDFNKVKASGVEIVYIKATEGVTFVNPLCLIHYNAAKLAGLKIGFYHFLQHDSPVAEAQHFLATIEGLTCNCKHIIDVEDQSKWTIAEASLAVRQFEDYLISKNKEVAIYTDDYFYRDTLDCTVKDLPLWLANYGSTILAKSYIGLQYSSTGRIDGISGDVDLDNFDNGILLKTVIAEVKKVKYLVAVGNSVDKRAGEYLADSLQCPVIDASLPFDYSLVENPIGVGGAPTTNGKLGWSSYIKTVITGADRYCTAQKVLDFIKNGNK